MRVGIIDLLTDTPARGALGRLYAAYFRKQFISIMPQVIAAWCRQLGHHAFYATYYGQRDPSSLLPRDLDVVFIAAYTQASALAYALAKLYRHERTLTVIGGPHAKSFPEDCARFFDIVVRECDRALIDDVIRRRIDPPAIVTSGRPLADFPSLEERMPDIAVSAFRRGRPTVSSVVPVLASVGCPYSCDFCTDWNSKYVVLPKERLLADLKFLSENYPGVFVGYHDPNFGVRFDETMDLIELIPEGRRNRYIMESSLSVLKESRLPRLKRTNCAYVAPGVESWGDYSNKAGVGAKLGREKLEQVVEHFGLLGRYVKGLQANFIFGADADSGTEPVELTKEFARRLPLVLPSVNIPTPFGGTPLYDRYLKEGRVLRALPFAFYYPPYLAITIKNYDPLEYYGHIINIYEASNSNAMLRARLSTDASRALRFINALRTFAQRRDLAELRLVRQALAGDARMRAFHEGRTAALPEFYRRRFEERLGPHAALVPPAERIPVLPEPGAHGLAPPAARAVPSRDGPSRRIAPALQRLAAGAAPAEA